MREPPSSPPPPPTRTQSTRNAISHRHVKRLKRNGENSSEIIIFAGERAEGKREREWDGSEINSLQSRGRVRGIGKHNTRKNLRDIGVASRPAKQRYAPQCLAKEARSGQLSSHKKQSISSASPISHTFPHQSFSNYSHETHKVVAAALRPSRHPPFSVTLLPFYLFIIILVIDLHSRLFGFFSAGTAKRARWSCRAGRGTRE